MTSKISTSSASAGRGAFAPKSASVSPLSSIAARVNSTLLDATLMSSHDSIEKPEKPIRVIDDQHSGDALCRARRQIQKQDYGAVVTALESVLAKKQHDPEALKMMGLAKQRLGDHRGAILCFREVASIWTKDADIHCGLGISLCETGALKDGVYELRLACKLAPCSVAMFFNLGEALARQLRNAEAISTLEHALQLDSDYVPARLSLARAYATYGSIDDAAAQFRRILQSDDSNAEAWFGLSYLNNGYLDASDVARLNTALSVVKQTAFDREKLAFALGKALESAGEYQEAFKAFTMGNNLGRSRVKWNASAENRRIDSVMNIFSRTNAFCRPVDKNFGRETILIASMPRSGSTLVEQILASHPQVDGANELRCLPRVLDSESHCRNLPFPAWILGATPADWHRLGKEYLHQTSRWRTGRPLFTDKSLSNWLLIGAAMNMLPASRVIIVRRDPVETCLSCFRECLGVESGFACDLEDTADIQIAFERASELWCKLFPERVIIVEYEKLLAEFDESVRRILKFCELQFSDNCLHFYKSRRVVTSLPSSAQVRRPIYANRARTELYGENLAKLRQRLKYGRLKYGLLT